MFFKVLLIAVFTFVVTFTITSVSLFLLMTTSALAEEVPDVAQESFWMAERVGLDVGNDRGPNWLQSGTLQQWVNKLFISNVVMSCSFESAHQPSGFTAAAMRVCEIRAMVDMRKKG